MKKRMKKAISPLIATVLIVGFTIVLAALVMVWGTNIFQGIKGQSDISNELQTTCVSKINPIIKSSCSQLLPGFIIEIQNNGQEEINFILVRLKGDNFIVNRTFGKISSYGIFKTELGYDVSQGIINDADVIPYVMINGKEMACAPVKISIQGCSDINSELLGTYISVPGENGDTFYNSEGAIVSESSGGGGGGNSGGSNVVSCIPFTCLSLGKQCGSYSNGCGGILNCDNCVIGYHCNSNLVCNGPCVENDGGNIPTVAGSLWFVDVNGNQISSSSSDSCTSKEDGGRMLIENYCVGDNTYKTKGYGCSGGCVDAICAGVVTPIPEMKFLTFNGVEENGYEELSPINLNTFPMTLRIDEITTIVYEGCTKLTGPADDPWATTESVPLTGDKTTTVLGENTINIGPLGKGKYSDCFIKFITSEGESVRDRIPDFEITAL